MPQMNPCDAFSGLSNGPTGECLDREVLVQEVMTQAKRKVWAQLSMTVSPLSLCPTSLMTLCVSRTYHGPSLLVLCMTVLLAGGCTGTTFYHSLLLAL